MTNWLNNVEGLKHYADLSARKVLSMKSNNIWMLAFALVIFCYFFIIKWHNPSLIEPINGQLVFTSLFLITGVLPLYIESSRKHYDNILFGTALLFQMYLLYVGMLNDFSMDMVLSTLTFFVGAAYTLIQGIWRRLIYAIITSILVCISVFVVEVEPTVRYAILMAYGVNSSMLALSSSIWFNYKRLARHLQKKLRKEINNQFIEIEKQNKLLTANNKQLETFAYVVSHDLKSPLRNMHSLVEWMDEDDIHLSESSREHLALLKEQVTQMDLIVEGVLDYSLLTVNDENQVDSICFSEFLEKIAAVNRSLNCKISIRGEFGQILYPRSELLQIFQNLISNAIKYNDKACIEIVIGAEKYEGGYKCYVSDNGPGIAACYHEKIFELFQTLDLKEGVDSVGIGLSVVKKIVESHGGRIFVESEPAHGATFYFTIPQQFQMLGDEHYTLSHSESA
ncbi:ATP-binding protein [Gilvibacter sp.]|uniref:sensor histidine kinase n=1 Tax=Gilvibacter sp. TaxID=2729997 RepID=UPI0025C05BB4|nr:ATP-binding protein [Gilvibacter sp.]NQX76329.1 hypothetical protein [Gilvibacter sp.]